MIRIEGIPVVAARLADAEKAKSRQTRGKQRKSHLLPIALEPVRLRSGSSGHKFRAVRMKLGGSGRGTM